MSEEDTLQQPSPLKAVDSFASADAWFDQSIFGMVESEMHKRWAGEPKSLAHWSDLS